jgi:hypothetical protein
VLLAAVAGRPPTRVLLSSTNTADGFHARRPQPLQAELSNANDSGARYCTILLLSRNQRIDQTVIEALISALKSEPSRENLRAIGATLAGVDPLKI